MSQKKWLILRVLRLKGVSRQQKINCFLHFYSVQINLDWWVIEESVKITIINKAVFGSIIFTGVIMHIFMNKITTIQHEANKI